MNEQEKADMSIRRGRLAAAITDPQEKREFIKGQGDAEEKGGSDASYVPVVAGTHKEEVNQAIGSRKHGGPINKTGLYKLHKGEHVISADETTRNSDHRAAFKVRAGALHRYLGIDESKPIPQNLKQKAADSDNPHVAKMGQFALNSEKWHKK
jgi:hypothetical protein